MKNSNDVHLRRASRPRRDDLDRRAFAQPLLAGADHHVVGRQSLADFHLPRQPLTENDFGLHRAAIHDAIDQRLAVERE